MKTHTEYMTFQTDERRESVRITEEVQKAVDESGVSEGMVLVSAMHITAGVWVNDDEPGIHADTLEWLDKIAPPSWKEPANDVARQLLPQDGGDYRHHRGGEDNGDAHLKNLRVHQQEHKERYKADHRPNHLPGEAAHLRCLIHAVERQEADH